jgi:3-hydroxybutyrate dehydrogenase
MIFGETEWQTNEMIEKQINVNLLGTIKLTHEMLPIVRKYKSRIINVTSHCSMQSLPTLAVYAASKAGLASFTDALRMEMKKYDVDVVNFVPGSFATSSNIAASQSIYAGQMKNALNDEQLNFYGDYFKRFNSYISMFSGEKEPQMLVDTNILETFEEALTDNPPKARYICAPMRYQIYHFLFKITPTTISDWLVEKFTKFPKYNRALK